LEQIFGKTLDAHNAAADAQMTMELYNYWRKQGSPPRGTVTGTQVHHFIVDKFGTSSFCGF